MTDVAYYAPGSGLGHVNRGLALCLALADLGVSVQLLTNSPFAPALAGLARCPIIGVAPEHAAALVADLAPRVLVMDTFPDGLRGERPRAPAMVHIARRLQHPVAVSGFDSVLAAEPLSPEHHALLGPALVLPGPIRLAPGRIPTPVPAWLDHDGYHLVVHSGPAEEVDQLTALAPEPRRIISRNYYPAVNLLHRAAWVYSGCGYNIMAEMLGRPNHTALPFPRRYDDQFARRDGFFKEPADGTALAAHTIASFAR
jgi:hypothetical protein